MREGIHKRRQASNSKRYRVRLNLQEKENPEHSPYWPRRPDMLVRRIIRGMLPYHKKPSGKAAYKRLRVFVGMPKELNGIKAIEVKTRTPKSMYVGYVYIDELSKLLGYDNNTSESKMAEAEQRALKRKERQADCKGCSTAGNKKR